MGGMMQDLAFAIPGVDEAMGFAEIMKWAGARRLCSPRATHPPSPSPSLPQARQVDGVFLHRL